MHTCKKNFVKLYIHISLVFKSYHIVTPKIKTGALHFSFPILVFETATTQRGEWTSMIAISSGDSPSPSHHHKKKRLMKLQEEEDDDYVDEKKKKKRSRHWRMLNPLVNRLGFPEEEKTE